MTDYFEIARGLAKAQIAVLTADRDKWKSWAEQQETAIQECHDILVDLPGLDGPGLDALNALVDVNDLITCPGYPGHDCRDYVPRFDERCGTCAREFEEIQHV